MNFLRSESNPFFWGENQGDDESQSNYTQGLVNFKFHVNDMNQEKPVRAIPSNPYSDRKKK